MDIDLNDLVSARPRMASLSCSDNLLLILSHQRRQEGILGDARL